MIYIRTEGDGPSRLIQLLRGDKRQESTLIVAQVTNVSPLKIRIPGYRDDIPEEAIIVSEKLKDHEIEIQLDPSEPFRIIKVRSPIAVGDDVICAIVDDGQLIFLLDKEAK